MWFQERSTSCHVIQGSQKISAIALQVRTPTMFWAKEIFVNFVFGLIALTVFEPSKSFNLQFRTMSSVKQVSCPNDDAVQSLVEKSAAINESDERFLKFPIAIDITLNSNPRTEHESTTILRRSAVFCREC